MLAQMSNNALVIVGVVGFIFMALLGVAAVIWAVAIDARKARKYAAEKAEWKNLGVTFDQLPSKLQAVMTAIAAVEDIAFPKNLKGIVFTDLSDRVHKFTCEICGVELKGMAVLYNRFSSDLDAVCMDNRSCFFRAQALLDERLEASKPSHKEAIAFVKNALRPKNMEGMEKPSGEVEEEGKGEEAKADTKEEA